MVREISGLVVGASIVIALGGCDAAKPDPTIAQAMETKSEMEVAAAKLADRRHSEAEQAQRAQAAQQAARATEIQAATRLPSPMPTELETACDAFVESFDTFMKAGSEKDVLQWWDGHRKKLGERRSRCMLQGSIEVAACGSVALREPLPSLQGVVRRDAARQVVQACMDEFGTRP